MRIVNSIVICFKEFVLKGKAISAFLHGKTIFCRMERLFFIAVLTMWFVVSSTSSWGQSAGDYRSKGTGNWNALDTWQLYNGNKWNTPTTEQGFPGQFSSPNVVTISNDHIVTLNISPTFSIGSVVIPGGNKDSWITFSGSNSLIVTGAISLSSTSWGDYKAILVNDGILSAGSIEMNSLIDWSDAYIEIAAGTVNVAGNITMNGNSYGNYILFSGAGTLNIGGTITGGGITSDTDGGPTAPIRGTVNYNNAGGQTVGNYNYYNLTLSDSGTKILQTGTISIGGNLTIDNASTSAVTELTIGGDVILERAYSFVAGAFTHTVGGNWTRNGWGTFTGTGSTINFTGNSSAINGSQSSQTFNNIVISKTAVQTLSAGGGVTTLNILGDLTLTSGNFAPGGVSTVLSGNWINNGGTLTPGSEAIVMKGSGKSIGGTTTTIFNNLMINNNAGGILLARDQIVNGTLILSNGLLKLGVYHLTLGATAPAMPGPFWTANMVVADGTGTLRKIFTSNGSYTFPIGDNADGTANLSPVTLTFNSGTYAAGAYAGVRVTDAKHPANTSATNYLTRYWSVSQSGISSFSCDFAGTYEFTGDVAGQETLQTAAQYTGALPWTTFSALGGNTLSATGISTFGDFTGIQVAVITPTQNTLSGFSYTEGAGPSAVQSFAVSGVNLTAGIVLTPPAGFEISTTSNSGYQSTALTIPQSGGFVYNVNVYVRLKAGLTGGDYSGNITATSTGAATRNIQVSGNVVTLTKSFRSLSSGNWNSTTTWQQSINGGATWSAATSTPVSTDGSITIRSPHTVTVTSAVSVDELTVEAGGQLKVNAGQTITIVNGQGTDMTLNGMIVNQGTITPTGTIVFNSGSTYEHAQNGGAIPTASWDVNSTCLITGYTTVTGNPPNYTNMFAQEFGHFTWNCTGQTSSSEISLGGNLSTIKGNLTVLSTGSGNLQLANTVVGNTSVSGNFVLSGGTFILANTSNTVTLNVAGNFTMSGGSLQKGGGTGNFNFNGSAKQTFSKSGGTISGAINFAILNNAIVDFGTSVLNGTDPTFNLNAGGTIITAHTQGISTNAGTGSIQVTGTKTYNNGAHYTYNGTVAQVTGNGLTGVNQLTIDNPAGVTLSAVTTVSGKLNLVNGILTSTTTNYMAVTNTSVGAIVGGKATSFVNGPLRWLLPAGLASGSSYSYPIGKGSVYLPFVLVNPITGTGTITAQVEAFNANAGGTVDGTLNSKSTTEYWSLVTSGNFTNSSISIARPAAIAPLNVIGASSTLAGSYTSLEGTEDTYGVSNSNSIGSNRFFVLASKKQSITTGSITGSSFCAGSAIEVPYTITGSFTTGNIFTAQLSDAAGSFASPVSIGTLSSTASGTIPAVIPPGTPTGSGYRIRVVSSAPALTGSDNGSNLTINASVAAPIVGTITQPTCSVATGSVVLSGLPASGWTLTRNPGGIITTGTGATTTVTGLGAGTYTFSVSEGDNSGTCPGTGTGLTGSYFNNRTLTGSPVLTRTDATVNFDWVAGGPGGTLPADNFSVRWTGMVQPCYSENYTFRTNSDDGIRLWVNGVQIINNWSDHAAIENTGTISLIAGKKYEIVLEYYENAGNAIAQLSWSSASQVQQPIPQTQLYPVVTSGCASSSSGNVVINVPPVTPPAPTVGTITQPTCSVATGSVVLSGLPSGSWTLTRSPGGTVISGSGTSTTLSDLSPGTYTYTVTNSVGCTSSASGNVVINGTFVAPAITGTTTSSRCGTGTLVLGATASAGTINWYSTPTGGSPLGTGNTFTTPSISVNTTYYVDATDGSCTSSPRVAVLANVIDPPSITASGGGTYCSGSTVNLSSSSTNITNQYWTGPNSYYSLSPNPVLTNVTSSMSGTYRVTGSALSGVNLVINGDFEMGNFGFTSDYARAAQTSSGLNPESTYDIVAAPSSRHSNFCSCADHTSGSGTLQMVVNGASTEKNVWAQTVHVNSNTAYQFTYWVQTVVNGNDGSPSKLQLFINGQFAGPVYTANPTTGVWTQFTYNWVSGSDDQIAVLELKNENFAAGGNDFALDDIVFQQACEAIDEVTVIVSDVVTAGSINASQTICFGTAPSALTSAVAGTGSGVITYEWETNASGSYETIPGATSAGYSPPALTATTSYRRRTISNNGGETCYSGYTNVITITVNGPTVNAGGPNTVCQSANPSAIPLTGAGYGGGATSAAWSIVSGGGVLSTTAQTTSPASVTYTPAMNYSGTVVLRLTTSASPCAAIAERTIYILPAATANAGASITTCSNAGAISITEGSSAGNYSSIGWTSNGTGTFTDASSLTEATYTPSAADITAGSITLTLTAYGNSPCGSAVSTKTLTFTSLPVATFAYAGTPYCSNEVNPTPTYNGGGVAGTFSSTPGLVFVSTATGQVNLVASNPGTYTVTNTIAAAGGCTVVSATASITITAMPAATIQYEGSPFCSTMSEIQPVTQSGTTGGSYTALPSGLRINAATGAVTPLLSSPGTYTVTYTIAALGGCSTVTATTQVTILPDGSWTGAVDQDWNKMGNWACNQIPTLSTDVVIASGKAHYPVLTSEVTGMAHHLTIGSNASVTVTGGKLQIAGNISNSGTFTSTEGTIEMKGSEAQTIGKDVFKNNTLKNFIINKTAEVSLQGPLYISDVVSPVSGTLHSGGNLTLLSTESKTALIDGSGSGNVTGTVYMQRYLPSRFGYKYFSSPFRSATVGAFTPIVDLTETFPTFYKYDENNSFKDPNNVTTYQSGWVAYTGAGNQLVPLMGYAANLKANASPITFTMSGEVNNGSLNVILENNNREFTKGFNLVGNPYPSPIDWDASQGWTREKIDGSIYFFNAGTTDRYTGTYTSYVNGQSTGDGDNIIAAMQGFFVHVSDDATYPVTGTLGMTNAVRANNLNSTLKRAVIDTRPTLRLIAGFQINNAIKDAALVYFDPTASLKFEKEKDALKIENTDERVPNIYTLTADRQKLSINGLSEPLDSLSFIPVGITTYIDGVISIKVENARELPFAQVYLADAVTGKYHDLRQSPDTRFSLQRGVYDNRFKLVFSKSSSPVQHSGQEKLFTLTRSANRILVKVGLEAGVRGKLQVTNTLGQVIVRKEVGGQETVEIGQDVSTGVYVITLVSGKRSASEKILMRQDYE